MIKEHPTMAAGTSGEATEADRRALIYLARHGQTPLNESGVLRGLLDPSLDEVGLEQARRLGAALGPRRPLIVVASPLRRAIQTAQPVADRAAQPVTVDRRFIDRDYGLCTGQDRKSVVARWGSVDDAPGVEPRSVVQQRGVAGLTDIDAGRRVSRAARPSRLGPCRPHGWWRTRAVTSPPRPAGPWCPWPRQRSGRYRSDGRLR
jgi:hypothetical protein